MSREKKDEDLEEIHISEDGRFIRSTLSISKNGNILIDYQLPYKTLKKGQKYIQESNIYTK